MRKTLLEIFSAAYWGEVRKHDPNKGYSTAIKAVESAVRKRVKRKLAADARRNEIANSKWVLR